MQWKQPHLIVLTGFTALSLSLAGCGGHPAGGPGGPGGGMGGGLPVETATLANQNIQQYQDFQGTLISRKSVMLQSRVAGEISKIYVKAGDRVKAGAPLIQIDARQQQATVSSSKAQASAVQAQIKQAQDATRNLQEQHTALVSSLKLNQTLANRYKNLFDKGAGSKQDLDQYTYSLQKAQADLNSNEAQIQQQRSAVITAKKNYDSSVASTRQQAVLLQFYRITAPFAGRVGDIPVKLGNFVGTDTQLLSVTENNPLELNVGLPADRAFDTKIGLKAVMYDKTDNPVASAALNFVSPLIDPTSQTMLVKANVANPGERLKANQSLRTRIYFSNAAGLMVPSTAVSHLGGQDFVFLVLKNEKGEGNVVKQTPVKLGTLQNGNAFVLTSGLKAGDVIVVNGIQKLADGAPVTVMTKGH